METIPIGFALEQIGFDLSGQGAADPAQIRSEFPSSNNHSYRQGGLVEKDRINRTLCSRTREPCVKRISAIPDKVSDAGRRTANADRADERLFPTCSLKGLILAKVSDH